MRGAYCATMASLYAKLPEASTTPRRALIATVSVYRRATMPTTRPSASMISDSTSVS